MGKTDVEGETKTYVELLYPGTFFSEDEVIEVKETDPKKIARKYPKAFAFRFFDQERARVTIGGKEQTVFGKRENQSPLYYPDAEVFTLDEVKALQWKSAAKENFRILIANMEGNGYANVVRTRCGNFQPFDPATAQAITS